MPVRKCELARADVHENEQKSRKWHPCEAAEMGSNPTVTASENPRLPGGFLHVWGVCGAVLVRIWVVLSAAVLRRARPWLRRVSLVVTLPGEHVRSTCESYPQPQEYPGQRGAGLAERM